MKQKEVTSMIPMNLQFFAEGGEAGTQASQTPAADPKPENNNPPEPNPGNGGSAPQGEEYTVEGLLAQLTQERAEKARMKTEYDKLCSSEGNLRKQLRAKQTAEEQAAEAEAEAKRAQEEHTAAVEKELATMKAANRYLELGFSKDEATKIAADEVNGDMDAWKAGVDSFLANQKKNAYAQARADLMKEMPVPQSGNSVEVDFSKRFDEAMSNGDSQAAIKALLEQAQAKVGVAAQA